MDPDLKAAIADLLDVDTPEEVAAFDLPQNEYEQLTVDSRYGNSHNGDQALHVACLRGDILLVEKLLAAGADINSQGEMGFTPVHYAAQWGHLEIVRLLLLKATINVDIKNEFDNLPVDIAKHPEIADLIRSHMQAE